jgi:predicted Ser/Thr protein kinase
VAEFELKMKENDWGQQFGLMLSAFLFPVWGVAVPSALVLFVILLLRLPSSVPLWSALIIMSCLALCTAIGAICTFICEDDTIRVSKEGLSFPLKYFPTCRSRLQYAWSELASLRLKWKRNADFCPDDKMMLAFKNGALVNLPFFKFTDADLEQFFIAFESCSNHCERDAELDDLEYALQQSNAKDRQASFTQIWEKSLARRFSGATFAPLEPGSTLGNGRFNILRQLGFGGFSAVYLARTSSGDNIVLKESVFGEQIADKATELFKRELEILSKLDHSNIAKVQDYFIEAGRHYICMEYFAGTDLSKLISSQGAQEEERVINWAQQLAQLLLYLHSQSPQVVHRDISPDNLLLRADGSLALIDFGAAKEIAASYTGTIIGKQAYMAPEQLKGKPTEKSDIYAFGATMYFLLTGTHPRALEVSAPKNEKPSVSANFNALIMQCTQQDEVLRPNAQALVECLRSYKPELATEQQL